MFNSKAIEFCHQLQINVPIIQAPMAGSFVSSSLIKEVAQQGALGTLALGYLTLEDAKKKIQETKALVSGTFAVNIFVSQGETCPSEQQIRPMINYLNKQRAILGLPALSSLPLFDEPSLDELIDLIIDEEIPVLSLTFGILSAAQMKKLRRKNIYIFGTATNVAEALALQESGCQAVIAQSYEAGGHRGGGFLKNRAGGLVGALALIPALVDALDIPIVAAGGIMDGRGIAAALCLGASAVQMGTAFLTCEESLASALHKQTLLKGSKDTSTCLSAAFTGKTVRAFENQFIKESEQYFKQMQFLPYPFQHQLTKELRQCANREGFLEYAGLWSGQGNTLSRVLSVKELLRTLKEETLFTLSQFK